LGRESLPGTIPGDADRRARTAGTGSDALSAFRTFLSEAPELHPWSLRFRDPLAEREFQDDYFDRNLFYIRVATILGAFAWAVFGPLAEIVVTDGLFWDRVIRYGLGVGTGLASFALTFAPGYRRVWQPLIAGGILVSALEWVMHRALVGDARPDWGYAGNMLILIFAYLLTRLQFRYSALVGLAVIAIHNLGALLPTDETPLDLLFGDYFLLITAAIGTVGAYFLERSQRLLFLRERELEEERGRSEGLLRNILPEAIADRLKRRDPARDHGHIAQDLDEVTVVFADLVGFTHQSGSSDADEVVTVLDEVFRRFDAVAERNGLETIKTIGDAYMAVAGVSVPRPDDADAAARAALAMRDDVRELRWPSGDPMHVKIGMATGPAVAGVIGRRKIAYDLWGDTVNTAARMESNGTPDEIQVSEAVYRRLRDRYRFSEPHVVDLKGMGPTPARFLIGPAEPS
jgi:class 3 adenylate cyclase